MDRMKLQDFLSCEVASAKNDLSKNVNNLAQQLADERRWHLDRIQDLRDEIDALMIYLGLEFHASKPLKYIVSKKP